MGSERSRLQCGAGSHGTAPVGPVWGFPHCPGGSLASRKVGLLLTLGFPGVSLQTLLVHSEEREDRTLADSFIKLNEAFIEILSFLPLFVLK